MNTSLKMTLRHQMMDAFLFSDWQKLIELAQATFDAGMELEDLELVPSVFDSICRELIRLGWSPVPRGVNHG